MTYGSARQSNGELGAATIGRPCLADPREREVAAQFVRGMSNRQIAEALVITERTAETHVCRILSKLGLDSRAQIAAWIIDNGLLDARPARAS